MNKKRITCILSIFFISMLYAQEHNYQKKSYIVSFILCEKLKQLYKKPITKLPPNTLLLSLTIDGDSGNSIYINHVQGNTADFLITDGSLILSTVTNNFSGKGIPNSLPGTTTATNSNIVLPANATTSTNISNFTIKTAISPNHSGTISTLDAILTISISDVMGYFSTSSSLPDIGYIPVINGYGYGIVKSSTTNSYAFIQVNGTNVSINITTNAIFYVLICTNFFPTNPCNIIVTALTNSGKNLGSNSQGINNPQGTIFAILPFDTTVTVTVGFISILGLPTICTGGMYVFIADSYSSTVSNTTNALANTQVTPSYSNFLKIFNFSGKTYSAYGDTVSTGNTSPVITLKKGVFINTNSTNNSVNTTVASPITLTTGPYLPIFNTQTTTNTQNQTINYYTNTNANQTGTNTFTITSTVPLQTQSAAPLQSTINYITPGSFFINAIVDLPQ